MWCKTISFFLMVSLWPGSTEISQWPCASTNGARQEGTGWTCNLSLNIYSQPFGVWEPVYVRWGGWIRRSLPLPNLRHGILKLCLGILGVYIFWVSSFQSICREGQWTMSLFKCVLRNLLRSPNVLAPLLELPRQRFGRLYLVYVSCLLKRACATLHVMGLSCRMQQPFQCRSKSHKCPPQQRQEPI